MKVTITAKVQIIVTSEQSKLIDETMIIYRNACNYVSNYVFNNRELHQHILNKELYYSLREKFGLKAQLAQSVIKTVIARYKAVLKNQKEWIKVNFKKPQCDLVRNRDYSLTEDHFSVNTLEKRIKVPYIIKGMEKFFNPNVYKFGTAKIVKKFNKYFLHISVTTEVPNCNESDICNVVGIDRGINFIIATYDSKGKSTFVSGNQIKQIRAKFKQLRSELQRRKTSSARRRLKRIGQRENRWMQDINHQVSKALVMSNDKHTLFVLEDLTNIRNATERVKRNNRYLTVSWSYYDLEQKIKYKASLNESLVINVDPRYTSQTCPKCGHTEKDNRIKKIHLFKCKNCGYMSNDDRIGGMNLYRKGIDYLSRDTVAI